jgi:hypothetical protein
MTSQNPASPTSQNSQLDRDILAKVNAHADRSLDRLFADIDELLSGDLSTDATSSAVVNRPSHELQQSGTSNFAYYPDELQQQRFSAEDPQADFTSSRSSADSESPQPATPNQQKKRLPLWMKAVVGIGVTSIAVGGGLLWLVNERKIELPKNLDTSWLPFQSKSQVSAADAKFAEYMQKSIAKIEAARTQTPVATQPINSVENPATTQAAPPSIINPAGTISAAPSTEPAVAPQSPILLLKTFPSSRQPSASFNIDGRDLTIDVGKKIGTSQWSLLTVTKGEVLLKKTGGEIRSIHIGQKF